MSFLDWSWGLVLWSFVHCVSGADLVASFEGRMERLEWQLLNSAGPALNISSPARRAPRESGATFQVPPHADPNRGLQRSESVMFL